MRSLFLTLLLVPACAVDPSNPNPGDAPPEDDPTEDQDDDDSTYADDDSYSDDDSWSGGDDDTTPAGDDDDGWPGDDDTTPPLDEGDESCADAFEASQTRFLSADDSNSMADPSLIRSLLLEYNLPASQSKPWEFLNAADWDYEPASVGHLTIEANLVPTEDGPGSYGMLVAVVAPAVAPEDRQPVNLIFAVDTSCSMGGVGLDTGKAAMRATASGLRDGDLVSLVRWSTNNSVVLDSHAVLGPSDPTLVSAINGLVTSGSTNLASGINAAYGLIAQNSAPGRANRVMLISDGGANSGPLIAETIADAAQDGEVEGTYLLGIGVPPASSYNHLLMDDVTDLGRGAYLYIADEEEAESRLSWDRLPSLLQIAAREVQLAVSLPPDFVIDEFSGEDIGTTPSEVVPQHLTVNDQMLFDADLLDCSPDGDSGGLSFTFTVEWIDPIDGSPHIDVITQTVDQLLAANARRWWKADAIVAFAQAFPQLSWMPPQQQGAALDTLRERVAFAAAAFPQDSDLADTLDQIDHWRSLVP